MQYFTFIFSIVIGIFSLWFSVRFILLYLRVKKWDRVKATVISKEIFIHPKHSTSRSPYGLKANYSYIHNDITHTGHMIYLIELIRGQANHIKSNAEKKLDTIKETMSIYVNPKTPKQSVIFCEGIALYVFVFCMGLLSLLLALSKIL